MEERDIKLLFQAGHWTSALVVPRSEGDGWQVVLRAKSSDDDLEELACKRGGTRIFKTSDSALTWCQQMGFVFVRVQLTPLDVAREKYIKSVSMINSILLVEDNEDEADLALHALKNNHITENVIVKRDGEEAIEYLFREVEDSGQLPSLIILDLGLPRISGLEVLEKIRQHESTKSLPVIVLTTSEQSNDIKMSYELGINSYVFKPSDFGQFNQVIAQLGSYWSELNILPAN